MTIKDLIEIVGLNKPFVFIIKGFEEQVSVITDDNVHLCLRDDDCFAKENIVIGHYISEQVQLIDWFEIETVSPKLCICDFHKVILVSGCQCGGQ